MAQQLGRFMKRVEALVYIRMTEARVCRRTESSCRHECGRLACARSGSLVFLAALQGRLLFQGLFNSPSVVGEALKGVVAWARSMTACGEEPSNRHALA